MRGLLGPLVRLAGDLASEAARTVERLRADRYGAAFRSLPFGAITTDSSGRILEMSPSAESLLGVDAAEAVGGHARKHVCLQNGGSRDPLARVLDGAEEQATDSRFSLLRKDGSRVPVSCTVNRLRDGRGDAIGALITIRDITAARDDEMKFQRLLAAAPDAMLLSDAAGRILLANDRASDLFGYTPQELGALSIEDLLPEPMRDVHIRLRSSYGQRPVVREMGGRTTELLGRKRDGTTIPLAISLSPFETASGTLVISAIRDVTAQRAAEKALTEARDRAEAAKEELEAFSYSVAHDLRSPLRSIDGFSQALLEDLGESLPPEALGHLRRVRASAQHMGHLIDDLLALSRVVRVELRSDTVDLGKICTDICSKLRESHPHREVETNIASNLVAEGDPFLLTIALENLLSNAWKFTSRQPRASIEIGARQGPEQVYFVQDNGAGFDMLHAARLFQPFQRLHPSSDFDGTGIGLATVKRIIGRHGGRIWAEAQPGLGATFFFTLKGRA